MDEKSEELNQEAHHISSWTWGLISSEELEKYLSTIVPRLFAGGNFLMTSLIF
jgi:hypothetical protein